MPMQIFFPTKCNVTTSQRYDVVFAMILVKFIKLFMLDFHVFNADIDTKTLSTCGQTLLYGALMAARRPPPPAPSLVQRKRSGEQQVRKTVYFLPKTAEKLDRYAFEHRLRVWEVVEMAVADFLDSEAARSHTSAPPSAPANPKKRATKAQSVPPSSRPAPTRRRSSAPPASRPSSMPPSTQPSRRPTTRPPRKKQS